MMYVMFVHVYVYIAYDLAETKISGIYTDFFL